ncbi:hypothetical protein [Pseudomonas brenneri]|uniref:hypothetical protein n=1 Tax=Pseudomonas brenneri TaxID=129817 RepID=UPI0028D5207A|nr:hypothetical protein [Pseudomonas brenneri]
MILLNLLSKLWRFINPDLRSECEKASEREFILAANSLKTLSVTDRGGVSIDPEELRDQIIAAREQLKHLVHKPRAPGLEFTSVADQGASPIVEALERALDCIEVVAWRRLLSGAAVRYTCLQCVGTGRFAVAAASLFSEGTESLPPWVDGNTNRQVACALQNSELGWYATVGEAMDAWDATL